MAKAKPKPRPPKAIRTQRALAAACHRHPSQVSRWIRDTRWTFGRGPWKPETVPSILRWVAELDASEGDEWKVQRARKTKLQADQIELAVAEQRGRLIDRAEVEARDVARAVLVRTRMQRAGREIAAALADLVGGEFRDEVVRLVDARMRAICDEFSGAAEPGGPA